MLYKNPESPAPGSSGNIASPEYVGPGATDGLVNDTLDKEKRRQRPVYPTGKKQQTANVQASNVGPGVDFDIDVTD